MTVRLPDDTHQRLKELARHRGVSVNKLMEELSTIAVAQHDAETRFRALAARGSAEEGLRVLDKLDAALGSGVGEPTMRVAVATWPAPCRHRLLRYMYGPPRICKDGAWSVLARTVGRVHVSGLVVRTGVVLGP